MSDLIKCRLDIILIRCRAECLKSDITFEIPGELKKMPTLHPGVITTGIGLLEYVCF